jgi:hypothetical protein
VVATAAVVVVAGRHVPLTGEPAPDARSVSGADRPQGALDGVLGALASRPTLVAAIVVLVVATVSAGLARRHGLWGVSAWGAAFLATLLLVPAFAGGAPVAAAWAAPAVWLATGLLAYPLLRPRR